MRTTTTHVEMTLPATSGSRGANVNNDQAVRATTLRFGELTVEPPHLISVPKGVLGFEHLRRYVILETPDSAPFKWFQSLDDPTLAFVIVNPLVFFNDYRIEVDRRELEELNIADPAAVVTYVIVSVPDGDLSQMSANLQGPILVNTENNLAKQLVLSNSPFTTRHLLLEQLKGRAPGRPRRAESGTPMG